VVDALPCEHCRGSLKIIAFVIQDTEIKSILEHLGIPTEARSVPQTHGPPRSESWPWQREPDEHKSDVDAANQDQSVSW
jgi:hypothetical protein